jgi:hypothetical protein
VDVSTTVGAAETELGQSAFDFGLRLQEFWSEHLRSDCHRVIAGETGIPGLVDHRARVRGLLGDRRYGAFEDARSVGVTSRC